MNIENDRGRAVFVTFPYGCGYPHLMIAAHTNKLRGLRSVDTVRCH
jgi:hypothetical protein